MLPSMLLLSHHHPIQIFPEPLQRAFTESPHGIQFNFFIEFITPHIHLFTYLFVCLPSQP